MLSRRNRILVVGAVLTVGMLATVLIQAPAPTQTVDALMERPDEFVGQDVAVRGEVQDGTIDNGTARFILEGETLSLAVSFIDAAVTNVLDDNRTAYAEGVLTFVEGEYVLEASVIKTSCPSKYEEEATTA